MKLSEEQATKLLQELDRIAQDVCAYDYGLPLFNEEAMPLMIAAVQRAISKDCIDWTNESPKVPGWYWQREHEDWAAGVPGRILEVYEADGEMVADGVRLKHWNCQWSSNSLQPPAESDKGSEGRVEVRDDDGEPD